jgi:uncharacterized membrane protein required for colicin V production
MQWFDWMTLGIVFVVAVLETIRAKSSGGFGQALFDALGLVVAALGSTWLAGPVANLIGVERWIVTLVVFGVLGIGALILGRVMFGMAEWSSDSFDGGLSFFFGVVCGWIVANMVLRIIVQQQGGLGEVIEMMPNAPVAREVFQFRLWNILMKQLFNVNLGPDIDIDVG